MPWNPLNLSGISFVGPDRSPAVLGFRPGLNVIAGASETGKSFIVEAIDFLLGSGRELREIKAREGYDAGRLSLRPANEGEFTIQRSTSGGHFLFIEGLNLEEAWPQNSVTLRSDSPTKTEDSLSHFLLAKIGLSDKLLQTDQKGTTRRLSFRDLARLVVVSENEVIKESSPILSEQWVKHTRDYAAFKLLLSGIDAASIATATKTAESKTESEEMLQENRIRVGLLDELISELRAEIEESTFTKEEIEDLLLFNDSRIAALNDGLARLQARLAESVAERTEFEKAIAPKRGRVDEIQGLFARFSLLKTHYQIDLERLASIEESGSVFIHLEKTPCPLCGADPLHQHPDDSDQEIGNVIEAAQAERRKIEVLMSELKETIAQLTFEERHLAGEIEELTANSARLKDEVREILAPIAESNEQYRRTVESYRGLENLLEKFVRLESLEQKRAALETEALEPQGSSESDTGTPTETGPVVEMLTSTSDAYAEIVQQILQDWHFPNSDRVHFDEKKKDLVIGGQPRGSRGKGLRAITHAAMTIGLMEFCKLKNLAHPGFVVLDSPLLAYYKPESEDDEILAGTDLKERFYRYLASENRGSQVIIIENEHPPLDVLNQITFFDFTKNPKEGRYGFFPYRED